MYRRTLKLTQQGKSSKPKIVACVRKVNPILYSVNVIIKFAVNNVVWFCTRQHVNVLCVNAKSIRSLKGFKKRCRRQAGRSYANLKKLLP